MAESADGEHDAVPGDQPPGMPRWVKVVLVVVVVVLTLFLVAQLAGVGGEHGPGRHGGGTGVTHL